MNTLRLCKIPSASHVLLTGGMEGHAKIWVGVRTTANSADVQDLRESGNAQKRYFKHSVAITSVAFCPDSTHHFLVGMDSGTIQRYDMRSPSRIAGKVWGAHGNKPVTDLKWKPGDEGGWMASAGADRTVQVSRG
jgi:WD40 repeat protein